MPSNFNTFKYAFLGTVLFVVTVIFAYQFLYAIPQKKCEAAGSWWSFRYRECARPMKIVDFPGMKPKGGATPAGAAPANAAATPAAASASAAASAPGHP